MRWMKKELETEMNLNQRSGVAVTSQSIEIYFSLFVLWKWKWWKFAFHVEFCEAMIILLRWWGVVCWLCVLTKKDRIKWRANTHISWNHNFNNVLFSSPSDASRHYFYGFFIFSSVSHLRRFEMFPFSLSN